MTRQIPFMDQTFVKLTLDWRFPIITAMLYLLYNYKHNQKTLVPVRRELKSLLTLIMFTHNAVMSIFSFHVFKNTFFILFDFFKNHSFKEFFSDPQGRLWNKLFYYFWIFYFSKYIEIIDTWIIYMNNRSASFLQVYHHTGAIICCWFLCKSTSHISWIFILFNSFVHSFMYLYYAATTVGIKSKLKFLLTYLQIAQFVIGFILGVIFMICGDIFSSDPEVRKFQMAAGAINLGYVAFLYVLFMRFAKQTYGKEKKD
ncbi:hypothetical protein H312_03547 [Anncaliia algerae PRA339]|uniref:Elongation of fatty acids protein n=1 Tax=Anncaliia algerae PRA339 TaxID=1288291 RepID=A0A059EWG9_9MICR|nr:hypothetical protein H312_03547 [Anncaliia algerae PRA339]